MIINVGSLLAQLPRFSPLFQLILALHTKKLMGYNQKMLIFLSCLWLKHFTHSTSVPSDTTGPSSPQRWHKFLSHSGPHLQFILHSGEGWTLRVAANSCRCASTSGWRNHPRAVLAPIPEPSPAHHQDQRHHFALLDNKKSDSRTVSHVCKFHTNSF